MSQAPSPAPQKFDPVLPTLFGEGYGIYQVQRRSFVLSFLLNTLFVVACVLIGSFAWQNKEQIKKIVLDQAIEISPYVMPESATQSGGGGGGGDRDKLQASKGALPKLSRQQITPPVVVVRNDNPKLAVPPEVVVPQMNLPQVGPMGDPLSHVTLASNGTGSGGGIGSGSGGGVGSGRGPGVGPGWGGGIGGGAYRVGGGVSAPRAIYQPDPEYSEEARKAKWQGTVVLWVVIGPDGKTRDIKIVRSLGMGLDEKAIEAVRTWRFEPGKKDGQPVAVQVNVEVNFRLY